MRMKIKAEKKDNGYQMIAEDITGRKEYPQEGRLHPTKESVYKDAEKMYSNNVWDYNPNNRTIKID